MTRFRHLTVDEREELLLEIEETIGAALLPILERLEHRPACPHCVARVCAVSLGSLCAWHAAFSAHGVVERDQLVHEFMTFIRSSIDKQLAKLDDVEAEATTPTVRGVH